MTPPLTDTELLAYIERTPEFTDNCWVEDALENGAPDDPQTELARNIARAFHAAEQRVREEAAALLRSVLPLLDGAHDASAQYEDMRGYTAEQIRDFLTKQGGK